jgi:hypothetical protein
MSIDIDLVCVCDDVHINSNSGYTYVIQVKICADVTLCTVQNETDTAMTGLVCASLCTKIKKGH